MIYVVKGPKIVHKGHLNQTKSGNRDEENNITVDVEPMDVLFDRFDVPIHRKLPRQKYENDNIRGKEGIPRELTLTRKGKDIDSVQSKSKKRMSYTRPMNINRYILLLINTRGCPCGVMVKAMHCGIVVREFVLQSYYYVHFRANTLGKGMNPLILPAMG